MSTAEPASAVGAASTASTAPAPVSETPAAVRPLLGMLGDQTAIVCEGDACFVVPGGSGAAEGSDATPGR